MYGSSRKRKQVSCGRADPQLSLKPRVPTELLQADGDNWFSSCSLWESVHSQPMIHAQGLNEEMADSVSLGGLFNILILCVF